MQIPFNDIYFNNDVSFAAVYKKIDELVKGDKFMAEIIDIKADTVILKLNDGSKLTAKSLVMPDAKIGERVVFAVKENSDGVIQIEFVKNNNEDIPKNFLNGLLNKFELPISEDNREVIRLLIKNDIPVNQENIDKAMFIKYGENNISAEKLLFLLEENIPLDKNTVSVLNDIMENNISLKNSIITIAEEMITSKDSVVGEKLFEILDINKDIFKTDIFLNQNSDKILKNVFDEIADKFFIKLHNGKDELSDAQEKISKIYETAVKGEEIAKQDNKLLAKAFNDIKMNLEFTSHINEFKQYLQIPFSFGDNRKEQCELYVFKNPKNSKVSSDNASMLLGLDMAFLGRVEVFINKNFKSLNIQIKSDKNESISAIKKNFSNLENSLKSLGYNIASISFQNIDEPFNITKKLDKGENTRGSDVKKKRFSFDMKI